MAAICRRSPDVCVDRRFSQTHLTANRLNTCVPRGLWGTIVDVRLLGYTRVSTTAQDARLQLDALAAAGVQARDVFSDITSGSRAGVERPAMSKLLAYAERGDVVVVWRIDRLGRSLLDVLSTVNLLRDKGVDVRSVSDGIDPATTNGRLMLGMLATLAEYERELITERVNAGIAAARESGTRFGRPRVDPREITEKLTVAAEARAKGRTAEQAARLVGWSRATLYRYQAAARRAEAAAVADVSG
ncbi:MAG: recombinase family protein [Pseudonocardiaceae bacterium]